MSPDADRPVPEISVCAPIFCEEGTLRELYRRTRAALEGKVASWELIFVDDGSTDRTWKIIGELAAEDARVRGVRLSRNFGLSAAASAALASARGRAVGLMDGDLQDPPEVIPELVARWRAGAEVVYTVKSRRGEGPLRRLCFWMFHRIFSRVSRVGARAGSGLFSLLDRKAADALLGLPESHRYLPGLRFWVGFRQEEVSYARPDRPVGQPRQSFRRLLSLAADGILSFSVLPLRLAVWLGLVVSILSFLGIAAIVSIKLFTALAIEGWSSYMVTITFFGGVQLLFLGVLGEYVGRIYDEVKRRPVWVVAEEIGGAEDERESVPTEGSPGSGEAVPKSEA